jgi:Rha family phage regulatory protein
MYLMTRDGFSFLVIGFEGKRAAHWKQMYIKAFKAMEQELAKQKAPERFNSQGP